MGQLIDKLKIEIIEALRLEGEGWVGADHGRSLREHQLLRRDGTTWTTDKDGILLSLLAAEITAVTGRHPGEHYRALEERFGRPVYERVDAPATREQKAALAAWIHQAETPWT